MIKDIMVHLDGSAEDEIRLDFAEVIASTWSAHLTATFTNLLPDLAVATPMDGGGAMMQMLSDWQDQAKQEGDAVCKRLAARLVGIGAPYELRRVDETLSNVASTVERQARCADLFVTTRPYSNAAEQTWGRLVEAVLFGSGRALLLLPPGYSRQGPVQTVLVAWNDSRAAARAMREGLSFIEKAISTVVLIVDPKPSFDPGFQITKHLAQYSTNVSVTCAESRNRQISQVLLDEAHRVSADLIVMGGYGHTRLREQVFGGATLEMLTVSEYPMLLAH
jgi:nucleotide-binding universal stress UspA family protein